MIKLNINLAERSYPIYITSDFSSLGKACQNARLSGKLVIVTDSNVDGIFGDECMELLSAAGFEAYKYVIPAGEKNKTLDTVKEIYKYLADLKLDRLSSLLALGGGVTGDVAGFAAATYLRGINFIQIPTTLLAQADSSVGGKVGVDFESHKNIVGAFYQPKFVYINVNTLKTLPERELKSGLGEVIKHGLIVDSDFYEYIDYNMKRIFAFEENALTYMTKMNCSIKGGVVEQDEKESGLRAILNFGHTIGHAVETVSGFGLLHGECVSIGMMGAYKLAVKLGMTDTATAARVEDTLENAGLPVKLKDFDVQKVYDAMFHDKKAKGGKLTFVLPKGIGEVIQCSIDNEELLREVLTELLV